MHSNLCGDCGSPLMSHSIASNGSMACVNKACGRCIAAAAAAGVGSGGGGSDRLLAGVSKAEKSLHHRHTSSHTSSRRRGGDEDRKHSRRVVESAALSEIRRAVQAAEDEEDGDDDDDDEEEEEFGLLDEGLAAAEASYRAKRFKATNTATNATTATNTTTGGGTCGGGGGGGLSLGAAKDKALAAVTAKLAAAGDALVAPGNSPATDLHLSELLCSLATAAKALESI